ncbi:MAG: ATP-dependent RecD-like DNA helicase, partial [Erysipelotrichaceae bacterium]|nr:ATP-dependent RecD-like DNA helicase [Erysipelotrichaceae bacterium]
TVLGINNLNILLKDFFNPQDEDKNSVAFRDKVYQEGDKVIQLKNYNDQNVYNGDIGTIIGINTDKFIDPVHPYLEIDFSGNIVFYKYEDLQDINLAYAISIHKSQGSEYPKAIVIITEDQSIMLNKRLIYTAITRTKSQLFIYCNPGLFENAVNRSMEKRRSFLLQFLMQE